MVGCVVRGRYCGKGVWKPVDAMHSLMVSTTQRFRVIVTGNLEYVSGRLCLDQSCLAFRR